MRTPEISLPERIAIGVALVVIVLQAVAPGDALEYQRAALAREPWRALTGHLVHINWPHALINAVALWVIARLYAPDLDASRQAIVLAVSALAISAAFAWLYPTIAWYRGLSGVLHGLFFAGAATWLLSERPRTLRRLWMPASLLAGGAVKVLLEQPALGTTVQAEWLGAAVVPQAHLVGAVCGGLLGVLFATANARAERQHGEQ